VIDMTALPELPSIFEEDVAQRYDTVLFLRRFAEDIVLPIELDGREHIKYVPTQVFTEYLRYAFPGRRPDGLVFSSARAFGRNYVLFCGPESVAVQSNHSDGAVITIDSATLTAHRFDWRPTAGA
jgi:RES domain